MTIRAPEKRRYVANSMNAALEEIKRDFGDDGRIISTREYVEGGFFGFMGTRKYEVIAVCPRKPSNSKARQVGIGSGNDFLNELLKGGKSDNLKSMDDKHRKLLSTLGLVKSKNQPQDLHNDQSKLLLDDLFKSGEGSGLRRQKSNESFTSDFQISTSKQGLMASTSNIDSDDIDALKSQMKEMQMGLKELRQFMMQGASPVKRTPNNQSLSSEELSKDNVKPPEELESSIEVIEDFRSTGLSDNSMQEASNLDVTNPVEVDQLVNTETMKSNAESLEELRKSLLTCEFDPDLTDTYVNVMAKIAEEKSGYPWTLSELQETLKARYRETVKIRPSIFQRLEDKNLSNPKIMVFVGPTGVGKTTTIAKLATCLSSKEGGSYRVALITIDTFKVGAVSQIKYYAQGIQADLEVIFRPEEILPAIQKHSDKDVILIDTVGRGPKSKMQISCLKNFLPDSLNAEIHLCMSATSRYKDMIETIKAFNHLGVDSLLFTKLDETSAFGPMLSILQKNTRDISYVTTGQLVPGDYRVIDRSYLAELMFSKAH